MSEDKRTIKDGHYLSDFAVSRLNERHGYFEFCDAQGDVSRAFANNAVHAFIESGKEAQRVERETGQTPSELVEQLKQLRTALIRSADSNVLMLERSDYIKDALLATEWVDL